MRLGFPGLNGAASAGSVRGRCAGNARCLCGALGLFDHQWMCCATRLRGSAKEDWDEEKGRRRLSWIAALGLTVALLGPEGAVGAGLHPKLLAKVGYGTVPIGFARSADGSLHVAFETNTSWGDSASGVGAVAISPSGKVGPQVQALAWSGLTSGSPNGIPGLAVTPSGALQAVFGGSPSGVDGPWSITSTDGGATWSAPADIGSGSMAFGDSNVTLQMSNGTPVLTAGCCGNIVIQQGFGTGSPTYQLTSTSDDAAGNTASAIDAKTGAVVASWDSNAGSGGIWLRQASPTVGAAQKVPIPSQYGTGAPLIVAGRDAGPGVFAAYPADYVPRPTSGCFAMAVGRWRSDQSRVCMQR